MQEIKGFCLFSQSVGKVRIMYLELLEAAVLPSRGTLFRDEAKKRQEMDRERETENS